MLSSFGQKEMFRISFFCFLDKINKINIFRTITSTHTELIHGSSDSRLFVAMENVDPEDSTDDGVVENDGADWGEDNECGLGWVCVAYTLSS